jgi:hypothetical protein
MPKKLIVDIYTGYNEIESFETEPAVAANSPGSESQPADQSMAPPVAAPGGAVAPAGSGEPTGGAV